MEIVQFTFGDALNNCECLNLCLGYFDGVHLGHQKIISSAKKEGYKVGVLTFDNSPAFILKTIEKNRYLTSISDKAEYFSSLGVDILYIMHFDESTVDITKDEFIEKVLKPINPAAIYCGDDFTFGSRGLGTPKYLSNFYKVNIISYVLYKDKKVSSRDIISMLQNGDVETPNSLMGRNYRINGIVSHGLENGTKLQYPTANLKLNYPYVVPSNGVYFGRTDVNGVLYYSLIFIGTHPTISPLPKRIIEVNLLDYSGDLYGKDIFVEFIARLRDERCFDSVDELKVQIAKDKIRARELIKKY